MSSSAAYLPSLVIGKASVGSRLAAVRRRRVVGAGSGHGNEGGNSDGGELHDERVVW